MKLKKIRVHEFKSIMDSNDVDITDITCLVGKNEAGKTAFLEALYKLNPIVPEHARFDVVEEYPRAHIGDYMADVELKKRDAAQVIQAWFSLEEKELTSIEKEFGRGCLRDTQHHLKLSKGYSNVLSVTLECDEPQIVKNLISSIAFTSEELRGYAEQATTVETLRTILVNASKPHDDGFTPIIAGSGIDPLLDKLQVYTERGLQTYIYQTYLQEEVPLFLYFDEFYQMEGQVNLEALRDRLANNQLLESDRPMLSMLELARINIDQLDVAANTQELITRLEGAGNYLTRRLLEYWSQNQHLQLRFDVRPGRPGDPPGFQTGTNVWVNVYDTNHWVSVRIGTRSRGFIWFFSFLAWFFKAQKSSRPMILLLDEPGVFLHASAQKDLLRFIEKELNSCHQVVYTTHSPFMIDAEHFNRVRIACELGMKVGKSAPEEEGTKVFSDPLQADPEALAPLQGALAYQSMSTLTSANTLAVATMADMFYIQGVTDLFERAEKTGLSEQWTLTPVGGIDKVSTFIALVGTQRHLNLAVLIDYHKKDQETIEDLCKQTLLKQSQIFTFPQFTGTAEADIEDMFDPEFYLELVNGEYRNELIKRIFQGDLPQHSRIVARLEIYFQRTPLRNSLKFNRYRPARYFVEHASELAPKMSLRSQDRFQTVFNAVNRIVESAKGKTAAD
jgi:AAA15 family ATPase/GTPase